MKIKECPRCLKDSFNNSPVSYTWWRVMGYGYMCWHCFGKLRKKNS